MAWIELGPFFDEEPEAATSHRLFVPDEGELPELRINGLRFQPEGIQFGLPYGLGEHLYIQIYFESLDFYRRSILIFFVQRRLEWVCFECRSHFEPNRQYDYRFDFSGACQVPDVVMEVILAEHHLLGSLVPTPETRRCHPDVLVSMSLQQYR